MTKDTMEDKLGKDDAPKNNVHDTVPKQEGVAEVIDICSQCESDPCIVMELEEILLSIKDCYIDLKSNKQI